MGCEGHVGDVDAVVCVWMFSMLTYNPDRRITAVQALYHPFFDIVDKSQ